MYRDQGKKNVTSMMTSRPKAIRTLEETYGVKYQTPSTKSTMKSQMKNSVPIAITLKDRGDMEFSESLSSYRPNCNRYIITASDRYEKVLPPTARRRGVTFNPSSDSTSLLEERRAEVLSKQQQYFSKVEKPISARPVTTKLPKTARNVLDVTDDDMRRMHLENFTRNRSVGSENDVERMRQQTHRHAQPQRAETRPKDISNDDKDDTEEFIVLIKREIEKSVTKSITEMMKNSLAEINTRVEKQATDIKKIGALMQKINTNLSGKITHYGEENSRHFRYLCMKSEYDKMFYQHQNQVTSKPQPPNKPSSSNESNESTQNTQTNNPQPSARTLVPENHICSQEIPKNLAVDDNMRGMVAQLKKFCLEYESKVILDEGDTSSSSVKSTNFEAFQHSFPHDEGNFSSDGMTPRSVDNESTSLKKKPTSKSISKQQSSNNFYKNNSSNGCGGGGGGGDD